MGSKKNSRENDLTSSFNRGFDVGYEEGRKDERNLSLTEVRSILEYGGSEELEAWLKDVFMDG